MGGGRFWKRCSPLSPLLGPCSDTIVPPFTTLAFNPFTLRPSLFSRYSSSSHFPPSTPKGITPIASSHGKGTTNKCQSNNDAECVKKAFEANELEMKRILPRGEIARLSCGLERVLFNPGVHWLRDQRTNVYNFDPYLRELVSPQDFNFDCVSTFVPPSQDETLRQLAMEHDCAFISSTSSISPTMSQIYFVLSRMKPLNLDFLSQAFSDEPRTYTMLTRSPVAVLVRPHGERLRSIMAEKIDEQETVLQQLGQIMERLLTEPKESFRRMLKGNSPSHPIERHPQETYTYALAGKMLLRSQLDCHDPRLPRQTFDLKTRAALPVRMDVQNYQKYRDYHLGSLSGLFGSFEREYFDMCRSAILKYNFQVRIGDMDGIFVAYHNAFEIFGFQYLSREEMDERIYGNSATGDAAFKLILQIYNQILLTIMTHYPADSIVRLTFSTDKMGTKLTIFAEDMEDQGKNIQQYVITLASTLNGIKTDQVLMNPLGGDCWRVNCAINRVKTSHSEYDSVRAKATKPRLDMDEAKKEMNFMRLIQRSTIQRDPQNKSATGPAIIAPWTMR